MKPSNKKRFAHWSVGLALAGLASTPVHATVFAYEGFSGIGDGSLANTSATGFGFTGGWDITSNAGGASTTQAAGLSYPGSYPGTHTAVGGNGRVTGATGNNGFLALDLDATADFQVNTSASTVYISLLAQVVGQTVTAAGALDGATRTQFNLASEYPRNVGFRINDVGSGSNNSIGTIGKGSDWNSNGVTYGDPNPLIIDTWGVANFNDVNRLYTGADFADGVDHLVLEIDKATSAYRLQVNPQADGSNDGEVSWIHTDGGSPVPFVMKAFGVEGGNDSSDRPVGDMVFDEIYIADSFEDAAGFFQVPEPSIALLGSLGLLGLLRRRRN